jgi:PPE-repeat protein
MNFAMLPPEINSGRMYEGPGSGSMAEAATAWERLARWLYTAAADCRAVTSKLAGVWEGPAPAPMIEAATRYTDWLNTAATHAEQAATQAAAATRAHETALAAMVPPSAVVANRAQRRSLVRANCLGLSSAAIAAAEADYERMWAQDADAMCAYARASVDASTMTPFTSPPTATVPVNQGAAVTRASCTWAVKSAPELISAGHHVMSAVPDALRALSLSPLTTLDAPLLPVTPSLSKLSSLSAPSGAIKHLNSLNKAAALRWLLPDQGGARGAAVIAGFGRGTAIGTLSVPHAWATATPIPIRRGTVA